MATAECSKFAGILSAALSQHHLSGFGMRKTRDLFKKIRDAKGTFHAKMGTIKDRNGMDLTEAEDIKKRLYKRYTEELYKKDLHDPDNHIGVITHVGPHVLESEAKWALGKHRYKQS